jgi:hypothetical protein
MYSAEGYMRWKHVDGKDWLGTLKINKEVLKQATSHLDIH